MSKNGKGKRSRTTGFPHGGCSVLRNQGTKDAGWLLQHFKDAEGSEEGGNQGVRLVHAGEGAYFRALAGRNISEHHGRVNRMGAGQRQGDCVLADPRKEPALPKERRFWHIHREISSPVITPAARTPPPGPLRPR